jgi:2Fe-2S ferredoxin
MARVKFVQRDGAATYVDVGRDVSVMMAAVRNGIRGIEGECGGEMELLSSVAAQRRPTSRLSCQLKVPTSIDELVVYVPAIQS